VKAGMKTRHTGIKTFLTLSKHIIKYTHIHLRNPHSFADMPSSKRSSGNWGPKEDKLLGDLLRSNQVNYRDRSADYLFSVMEEYFPNFISSGPNGRSSAVTRLRNKFLRFEQDLLQRGIRGKLSY